PAGFVPGCEPCTICESALILQKELAIAYRHVIVYRPQVILPLLIHDRMGVVLENPHGGARSAGPDAAAPGRINNLSIFLVLIELNGRRSSLQRPLDGLAPANLQPKLLHSRT